MPDGSDYVLPFNLAEQERKIYGVQSDGPRSGDIVLDCGANIGVTIREELAAGAQKIIGIEPAPENLECLRRNFPGEIASGRVVIVPKGVWDKEDALTLRVDPRNSAADSFVLRREGTVEGRVARSSKLLTAITRNLGIAAAIPSENQTLDQVELVAQATSEGFQANGWGPTPYHGYYYRMLKGQGQHAGSGPLDYVVHGQAIGGFAVDDEWKTQSQGFACA